MLELTNDYIRQKVADSQIIYKRGQRLYGHGAFSCVDSDPEKGIFSYAVDGNYGDYTTKILFMDNRVETHCDCPYPGVGCKHTVAVLLDVRDRLGGWKGSIQKKMPPKAEADKRVEAEPQEPYLTPEEIRTQAIEDRKKRSASESFTFIRGDMFKGEHLVETPGDKQYVVTLLDPEKEHGHCTCPDFLTNRLETCKHLIFALREVKKDPQYKKRLPKERFPFLDIYWDSANEAPRLFCERDPSEIEEIAPLLPEYFYEKGRFRKSDLTEMLPLISALEGNKRVRIQEPVFERLDDALLDRQLAEMAGDGTLPPLEMIKTRLYPYQVDGIRFALYKKAALIGDEMGLGKTLQAIVLAILKRDIFDFNRVLVVTLASLKEQWKREIERFSDEKAAIVAGTPQQRENTYENDPRLFKITNYEAVLRDVGVISRFKPDLIILDEAQRIKNFNTKTADAVKRIPRKHAMVLTGTPLENKLEDVYSIVQFLDPHMLSPLWKFAADHFMLSRNKKGKILGYQNLDMLHQRLKSIVIRRRKAEVLKELPQEVVNTYYLDMTRPQQEIHAGYMQMLMPLLNKKYLTPMDLRRIQELLLLMRRVCDSTYLIDRKTHLSPKLKELEGILEELVFDSNRKVVIFSEWTAMTFLIGKQLSNAGIPFVELTGKVPVKKRQALIDEFSQNPDCKVFLSTDAGGTGLNLQAADCVINFELPWNPAKMNQRISRVIRIGQKSKCINVVNLVMKASIEERIMAGIQLKTDLFKGVFDGTTDKVEFTTEKRAEMLNELRKMMGEEPADAEPQKDRPSDEIPEDTPHFLNPEALRDEETPLAYDAEEEPDAEAEMAEMAGEVAAKTAGGSGGEEISENFLQSQAPERIEAVLNSGVQFLSGVLEMATGKKMAPVDEKSRMIKIDRETGEVTMKFRLPGF